MYHCGCHGNLVTIAMRYVADVYHPTEPPYQIWTQYNSDSLDSEKWSTQSLPPTMEFLKPSVHVSHFPLP